MTWVWCITWQMMRRGRMVEYGTADAVFHHPQAGYTQSLLAAVPTL